MLYTLNIKPKVLLFFFFVSISFFFYYLAKVWCQKEGLCSNRNSFRGLDNGPILTNKNCTDSLPQEQLYAKNPG